MGLPWVFRHGWRPDADRCPLIGRLADRYGKLPVYRVVATIAIGLMLVVTNLPRVPLAVAVGVVGMFMLSNAGRMVAALTMITGSVERRLRGGFMSANSAVQHLASGLGALIGGQIVVKTADGRCSLRLGRAFRRVGDRGSASGWPVACGRHLNSSRRASPRSPQGTLPFFPTPAKPRSSIRRNGHSARNRSRGSRRNHVLTDGAECRLRPNRASPHNAPCRPLCRNSRVSTRRSVSCRCLAIGPLGLIEYQPRAIALFFPLTRRHFDRHLLQ